MAPSRRRRRRPLPEDLIPDILVRLRPDDPAGIVRASAVCKAWRRIITDPGFHGRYRALHPTTAPVLGFLHNPSEREHSRFVSTTSFRPVAADNRRHVLDCRHGRAVFYDYGSVHSYAVWDPATGELHKVPCMLGDDFLPRAAVVCAAAGGGGCDHRGCGGGPFIVAFVGLEDMDQHFGYYYGDDDDDETTDDDEDDDETTDEDDEGPSIDAHAGFYASDTGEFTGIIDIHLGQQGRYGLDGCPAALVGDSLYFLCTPRGILRYRYGLMRRLEAMDTDIISEGFREADVLSMMDLPSGGEHEHLGIAKKNTDVVVMAAEGGGELGLACLCPKTGTMLYLLARETQGTAVGDDIHGRWVQRRVIDLRRTLLPIGNDPRRQPCLRGVSQEANLIFVSTEDGVFSIDLGGSSSSLQLQTSKVCEKGVAVGWMYPFVSFYTESMLLKLASRKLPAAPVGKQRSSYGRANRRNI